MKDDRNDQQLVEATRVGDTSAFATLFRRHLTLGRWIVAQSAPSRDVDDIVQESFASIYEAILNGAGPRNGFLPYFRTTLRNTMVLLATRRRNEVLTDDIEQHADVTPMPAEPRDLLDASTTAFRSLPERWQTVLYLTAVENMQHAVVGTMMGMSTAAVGQLAHRAREGLRQAWLSARAAEHAQSFEDCRWASSRLDAHALRRASARDRMRLRGHLAGCTLCAAAVQNVTSAAERLLAS